MPLKQEAEILSGLGPARRCPRLYSVTEASAKVMCCTCQAHG
jgi:hypothetical protein